jgi:hypothetical protein
LGIPALSDEVLLEAVALRAKHPSSAAAARDAGMKVETLKAQLRSAAARGLAGFAPVLEGFEVKEVSSKVGDAWVRQTRERGPEFEVPAGHAVKGVSALVDGEGRTVQKWIKTKEGVLDPIHVAEHIAKVFANYKPAAPKAPSLKRYDTELCTLIPCNDWHIGMFSWGKQTGKNWDLKIAEKTIGDAAVETVTRTPASKECIILGGGDLLHADNKRNETTGGTPQDVDGRYEKGIDVATRLMLRTIDAALRRHQHVTVRILKGNHDEHASVAVLYFLKGFYRKEPRITIDSDPADYFWFRFGQVILGACHGHQSSNHIAKMPSIMAHRRAEDWGATKHRYVHGFHLHHSAKIATEGNGVICEVHQAPIPQDAWHFASGFLSGRSMQAITYHAKFGEIGRVRTAIMDA